MPAEILGHPSQQVCLETNIHIFAVASVILCLLQLGDHSTFSLLRNYSYFYHVFDILLTL